MFTNVSGLKGGNFVRIAGVEVGKVKELTLHKDGTVTVDFAIDKGLTLTEGTKAAVRYENLIGDRYLALEDGPGLGAQTATGTDDPAGADRRRRSTSTLLSAASGRCSGRWIPTR